MKRLKLKRETVRRLGAVDLAQVAGGESGYTQLDGGCYPGGSYQCGGGRTAPTGISLYICHTLTTF